MSGRWAIRPECGGNDGTDSQHVVFAQVRMHKSTFLEHRPHDLHTLQVQLSEAGFGHLCILQTRSSPCILPDEVHEQHVPTEVERFWTGDPEIPEPFQVSHLLLRPGRDHFPRITGESQNMFTTAQWMSGSLAPLVISTRSGTGLRMPHTFCSSHVASGTPRSRSELDP